MSHAWQRTLIAAGLVVGIAIVGLLSVIAYALLSDDDGGADAEVAHITPVAALTPSPTATPRATPSPTPTAALVPTPTPTKEQPPPTEPPPMVEPQLPTETPIDPMLQSCLGGSQEACVLACAGGIEDACGLVQTATAPLLSCPMNYTYDASADGCVPVAPHCSLDPSIFSTELERAERGECRWPFVLCRVGEEFDPLQQKCVPSPGGSPGYGPPPSQPESTSCGYGEYYSYAKNRCVPDPSSCTPEEEYDWILERCVPKPEKCGYGEYWNDFQKRCMPFEH